MDRRYPSLLAAFVFAALLPLAAHARGEVTPAQGDATPDRADTVRLALRAESRLWLEGGSNLHDWSCEARSIDPRLTLDRAGKGTPPTRVQRATMKVAVAAIECGNGKMDDNLRKALKADTHPDIHFEVTRAEIVDAGGGLLGVSAYGRLTVAGVTRELALSVQGTDSGDGALRIQGRTGILMTDFGVDPPSALLGLLKTANEVTILFDLVMDYADLETRLDGPVGP